MVNGKVYQSINWVFFYYKDYHHGEAINFDNKDGNFFEHFRKLRFNTEKYREKK